mmetsp:Transcript_22839/g.17293  ORF Transcript_22839/g.17293 Transcript_22839/m.17293 type:complete len:132 (+) Transcript_22839:2307-2702(+)
MKNSTINQLVQKQIVTNPMMTSIRETISMTQEMTETFTNEDETFEDITKNVLNDDELIALVKPEESKTPKAAVEQDVHNNKLNQSVTTTTNNLPTDIMPPTNTLSINLQPAQQPEEQKQPPQQQSQPVSKE